MLIQGNLDVRCVLTANRDAHRRNSNDRSTPDAHWRIWLPLVGLTSLVPLSATTWPPLIDYLPHLSRVLIEHDLLTRGEFSDRFHWNLQVVPNLGLDLVILPLTFAGVPIGIAGRLFVAMVIVLTGASVVLLHRALFRRWSPVPLVIFGFSYTEVLIYGFLNCELAVASSLIAFTAYLHLRSTRSLPLLLAFGATVTFSLFLIHLLGAAVFLGLLASHALSERWIAPMLPKLWGGFEANIRDLSGARKSFWIVLSCLTVLAMLMAMAPVSVGTEEGSTALTLSLFKPQLWRWRRVFDALLGYQQSADFVLAAIGAAALALAGFRARLRIASVMVLPISGVAVLFFVVPAGWGTTWYIPERFPFLLMLLALSSVDVRLSIRGQQLASLFVAALIILKSLDVTNMWMEAENLRRPIIDALSRVEHNSVVCQVEMTSRDIHGDIGFPLVNVAPIATLSSGAFAPVFATFDQNLIIPLPHWSDVLRRTSMRHRVDLFPLAPPGKENAWSANAAQTCDYLLATRPGLYQGAVPTSYIPVARTEQAVLYRSQHEVGTATGRLRVSDPQS